MAAHAGNLSTQEETVTGMLCVNSRPAWVTQDYGLKGKNLKKEKEGERKEGEKGEEGRREGGKEKGREGRREGGMECRGR